MSSLGQSMKSLQKVVPFHEGTNEVVNQKKELFGLKLWQLGLLLGVPTAFVVAYLMYKKKPSEANSKNSDKSTKQGLPKVKTETPKKKIEEMVKINIYYILYCHEDYQPFIFLKQF